MNEIILHSVLSQSHSSSLVSHTSHTWYRRIGSLLGRTCLRKKRQFLRSFFALVFEHGIHLGFYSTTGSCYFKPISVILLISWIFLDCYRLREWVGSLHAGDELQWIGKNNFITCEREREREKERGCDLGGILKKTAKNTTHFRRKEVIFKKRNTLTTKKKSKFEYLFLL